MSALFEIKMSVANTHTPYSIHYTPRQCSARSTPKPHGTNLARLWLTGNCDRKLIALGYFWVFKMSGVQLAAIPAAGKSSPRVVDHRGKLRHFRWKRRSRVSGPVLRQNQARPNERATY